MGTKQGYAITTWRLRLRCKHPEWLETTQNFYNEIQKFYYDLYLERPELWNENSQNALRGLETLSIPGRTRKQVEYFRNVVKQNEGYIKQADYLSKSKKIQFSLFMISPCLYRIVFKTYRKIKRI